MSSDRHMTSLRIDDDLWQALIAECEATGKTQNSVITEAIRARLSLTAQEQVSLPVMLRELGWPYGEGSQVSRKS